MNLAEIEAIAYERLGYGDSADSKVVARIRHYINDAHRGILGKKQFEICRRGVLPVTTTANSKYLALPFWCSRVNGIRYPANDRDLDEVSLAKLRAIDPGDRLTGGFPSLYAIISLVSAVVRPPADASQIWVKSSAVGDTTQSVIIEGISSAGYPYRETVALNGTTAVQVGSAADWSWVSKFYLSAITAGNITLYEDSGTGTVLSVIPADKTAARYTLLRIYPTPSDALSLEIDCEVKVLDMADANDEPLIPEEHHEILALMACSKEALKREKIGIKREFDTEVKEKMADLYHWAHQHGGSSDSGGRSKRWSQLGPWFPAGS